MANYTIAELNTLKTEAKNLDREAYADFRSSILLIAGEHYSKRMTDWWNRARTTSQVAENYRLRITKNWLHRAHRIYMQSILGQAPGVKCSPKNATELQHQKQAELNQSVWDHLKVKHKLKSKYRRWVSDFCGPGECCAKIFWDPNRGDLKGYQHQTDPEGNPVFDEMGQPMPDEEKPVFRGDFVFEHIPPQNVFRDPGSKNMEDSPYLGIEKLESLKTMQKLYEGQPDKLKYITESSEEFVVFDSTRGGYLKEKDQVLISEYYFKPCHEYPNGYFYITTNDGILEEGELPFGIFPIVWKGFDEHTTKCRATGIVKIARPWQAEINRASSQQAMHQVTISEDKILYQQGTRVSQGALLPGVRGLTYQGAPPTVLPGRAGEQYVDYLAAQKSEMDEALMLDLVVSQKNQTIDPFAMLFRSMAQSQNFSLYSDKFGEFLMEMCEVALELAKHYLDDDEVISAVGKAEQINIQEFRSTSKLCYSILLEEQEDTIETKFGRQLVTNHILQYVGPQLQRDDIGKLMANMPFGNWEEEFSDFMIDYKNAQNDMLALERGEHPRTSANDNSKYILTQVAKRKKERDFPFLPPNVQQLYMQYEQMHEQKMAAEAMQLKQAESEFIPTGGAMIAADMYVPNEDPAKTPKRVRVPYQALDWLLKQLESQGMSMQAMEQMNQAQMAEVATKLLGGAPALQPQGAPQLGQARPA